jgi:hypothetical protein
MERKEHNHPNRWTRLCSERRVSKSLTDFWSATEGWGDFPEME